MGVAEVGKHEWDIMQAEEGLRVRLVASLACNISAHAAIDVALRSSPLHIVLNLRAVARSKPRRAAFSRRRSFSPVLSTTEGMHKSMSRAQAVLSRG